MHKTDRLAELVCSNSFRGDKIDNAVGLLKEEMRRLGSLVIRAAEAEQGSGRRGARRRSRAFLGRSHQSHRAHPLITVVRDEVTSHSRSSATHEPGHRRHGTADARGALGRHRARSSAASTCISTMRSARSCWPRRSIATKVFRAVAVGSQHQGQQFRRRRVRRCAHGRSVCAGRRVGDRLRRRRWAGRLPELPVRRARSTSGSTMRCRTPSRRRSTISTRSDSSRGVCRSK